MFPSGSRHSTDVKGGVAVITKMAKVKIMPVVYAGPMQLKGLLTGERVDMNFGNPIDISDIKRMNDEGIEEVANRIQTEFDRLDAENATFTSIKTKSTNLYLSYPTWASCYCCCALTLLFSYIASFVWDPDKHRK